MTGTTTSTPPAHPDSEFWQLWDRHINTALQAVAKWEVTTDEPSAAEEAMREAFERDALKELDKPEKPNLVLAVKDNDPDAYAITVLLSTLLLEVHRDSTFLHCRHVGIDQFNDYVSLKGPGHPVRYEYTRRYVTCEECAPAASQMQGMPVAIVCAMCGSEGSDAITVASLAEIFTFSGCQPCLTALNWWLGFDQYGTITPYLRNPEG